MDMQQQMNFIDVLILLLYIGAIFKGAYHGFIAQMSAFVGAILGIGIASQTYTLMAEKIQVYFNSFSTACIVSYVLTIFLVLSTSMLLGKYIKKLLMIKMATWLDHILGGLLGFVLATYITLLAVYLCINVQDLHRPLQNSILIPYVNNTPEIFKQKLLPLYAPTVP